VVSAEKSLGVELGWACTAPVVVRGGKRAPHISQVSHDSLVGINVHTAQARVLALMPKDNLIRHGKVSRWSILGYEWGDRIEKLPCVLHCTGNTF